MLWLGPTLRAFQRDYWRDYPAVRSRYASLHARDEAAFAEAAKTARDHMDAKALVAVAEIRAEHGQLDQWDARAASVALLAYGGVDRALDLLLAAGDGARSPKFETQLARALAAKGLLHEASRVLARIDASTLPIERALAAQHHFREEPSWTSARELVDAFVFLEAEEEAEKVVRAALMLAPDASKTGFRDMLRVLECGVAFGIDRAAIGRVIARALPLNPNSPDLRAIRLLCAGDRAAQDAGMEEPEESGRLRFARAIGRLREHKPAEAARQLERLCEETPEDADLQFALAVAVGQGVIDEVRPRFEKGGGGPRKIINVAPFSKDVGLLRIHLGEMADWVDHFVIVEADQTLDGTARRLELPRHKAALEPFISKITYLPISFPDHLRTKTARSLYQRDIALRALPALCREDDYVLVTDVGEVVDRRAIESFEGDFAGLRMPAYRFFFNYGRVGRPADRAGAIVKAGRVARYGISSLRLFLTRFHPDWPRIVDAGWIFNSIGGSVEIAGNGEIPEDIKAAKPWAASLYAQLRRKEFEPGWTRYPLDNSFPKSLLERAATLTPYIL
jgi:hypothetical protein